ncbi:MAG: valine--tRNA ligase [Anaerolineae bacterium]
MSREMPKTFNFREAEPRLYQWWEQHGWFKPEIAGPDAEPFVISIPPPNVTGELHQGHAMFVSLEDLMIRYERMRGKAALWVPGTDHAGIATQLQVEKMLEAEGTTREAIGREEFLRRTWEWKERYGGRIVQQLRRLGASCDWDRERFTMDEGLSRAVLEAFVTLWEQGLIYRGPRLVNWSPRLRTAVSDLEVEYEEVEGTLYYFKYRLQDDPQTFIPVATTRPETILGDTAVAVHPEDERYRHFVGRRVLVPILNRPIPVIADEYVDREFGTGALKVTPGHDPNDYEIGERHNLDVINILNKDATLNENAGPYAGLDRFEARRKLWADMQAADLTLKEEPYRHSVPVSQRGGELVEPLISEQWFVRIQPLAEKAIQAVREGRIRIVPERFEKVYFHWMENIRDWCISRQLWWGHRIPAWYGPEGEIVVSREGPPQDGRIWTQDPDVLDTWFSSALWPFSTLGWPDETPDYKRYYPTDVMETGYDILFFWVARMIMMGLWFTGKEPFHTVYLHGLVRDEQGRKMSKTTGNVIDPVQNIEEYGADALRFTLLTGSTPGNDMNLSEERIRANRNFGNKIWQMARFVTSNLEGESPIGPPAREGLGLPERWILSRLHTLIGNVQRLFDTYQYGEAGRQLYDFLWSEYADWYIEISKETLYGEDETAKSRVRHTLTYVLETSLRLLHPFMPYVTEEIWQYLPHEGPALIIARWPEANPAFNDPEAESDMAVLIELIRGIRNVRAEYEVDPARHIKALTNGGSYRTLIANHAALFTRLSRVEAIQFLADGERPPARAATVVVGDATIYLPLAGMIDLEAEQKRLRKELDNLGSQLERSARLLNDPNFVSRAKPEVVAREREKLADLEARQEAIKKRLETLSG